MVEQEKSLKEKYLSSLLIKVLISATFSIISIFLFGSVLWLIGGLFPEQISYWTSIGIFSIIELMYLYFKFKLTEKE
jgi:hypothetical protein